MQSEFVYFNNSYYRRNADGTMAPVTDPDTLKALKSDMLPHRVEPKTRSLTFSDSGANQVAGDAADSRSLAMGGIEQTKASTIQPIGGGSGGDIKTQLNQYLQKALKNYSGVSTLDELRNRKDTLVARQLVSPAAAPAGTNVRPEFETGLISNRGAEFNDALSSVDREISKQINLQNEDIAKLSKIVDIAQSLGIIEGGTKRDTTISEVNGRKLLVDLQTGETIKDLGAAEVGGGKKTTAIPSTTVQNLTEGRSLPQVLDKLETLINENKDKFGAITGSKIPFTNKSTFGKEYDKLQDDLSRAAQVVGKFLEGGKLAEGDIGRYREMLPALNDRDYTVALDKLDGVRTIIQDYYNNSIEDLRGSGYNTAGFSPMVVVKGAPAETKIVNGVKYIKVSGGWKKQ